MGRQRVFVGLFGALVLAALLAAVFLVLGDPPGDAPPDDGDAAQVEDPEREESTPEKRRRAGHEGRAALFGRLVRGKDRTPVAGESVRLDREGLPGWTAVTDDGGTFRFERLPHGGPFTVSASVAAAAGWPSACRELPDLADLDPEPTLEWTKRFR